jgi:aminoglycoside phosphotransferase (APT) family kinase protein
LHAQFLGADVGLVNPYLFRCDAAWFGTWAARARERLAGSEDHRSRDLIDALDRYGPIADRLAAMPKTFVHGEYFPSNIIVDPEADPPQVWPVDWEMAAVGPCLLDAAALVSGWRHADRERLVAAYRDELLEQGLALGTMAEVLEGVRICQLHYALQWLGWSRNWNPPAEHARDWLGEALAATRELSLP